MVLSLLLALSTSTDWVSDFKFVETRGEESGRTVVFNPKGRRIASIAAFRAWFWDPFPLIDLNIDGAKDVVLATWTGGAHASFGYILVSLGKTPRVLVAYGKGNGEGELSDFKPVDLDGDGVKEIVTWSDGFAYRLDAGYAPAHIPMILGYRRGRYVDVTASFPNPVRAQAKRVLGTFDRKGYISYRRVDLAEFLACKIILNEEAEAWAIVAKLDPYNYKIMRRHRTWIRRVVEDRKLKLSYPRLGRLSEPKMGPYHEPTWRWE